MFIVPAPPTPGLVPPFCFVVPSISVYLEVIFIPKLFIPVS